MPTFWVDNSPPRSVDYSGSAASRAVRRINAWRRGGDRAPALNPIRANPRPTPSHCAGAGPPAGRAGRWSSGSAARTLGRRSGGAASSACEARRRGRGRPEPVNLPAQLGRQIGWSLCLFLNGNSNVSYESAYFIARIQLTLRWWTILKKRKNSGEWCDLP